MSGCQAWSCKCVIPQNSTWSSFFLPLRWNKKNHWHFVNQQAGKLHWWIFSKLFILNTLPVWGHNFSRILLLLKCSFSWILIFECSFNILILAFLAQRLCAKLFTCGSVEVLQWACKDLAEIIKPGSIKVSELSLGRGKKNLSSTSVQEQIKHHAKVQSEQPGNCKYEFYPPWLITVLISMSKYGSKYTGLETTALDRQLISVVFHLLCLRIFKKSFLCFLTLSMVVPPPSTHSGWFC